MWARGGSGVVVEAAVNAARRARGAGEIEAREWYALSVAPQAELLTVRLLAERGLFAFAPTRTVWRRANRMARRKSARTYADLPGYALVGFEPERPCWAAALAPATVRGVLGWAGRPRRLSAEAVRWAAARSSVAPDAHAMMRTGVEFSVGDAVALDDDALGALSGRVVAIDGASARVLARFLGAERELVAPLGALRVA